MKYILLIFSLFFILPTVSIHAQVPLTTNSWSGYVDASPHGNFANVPTGTGVTFSQWRRFNNSTYQSATDGYNSQNLNGSPLGYIASYIKTDANTSLNITELSFVARKSSTGPPYFRAYLHFPATGVMTLIGTGYLNNTNNQTVTFPVNFCIPANDSVELRLVVANATHAAGTFRIVNGTAITATTNALCNLQNVAINPPAVVCLGEDGVIALSAAPGMSIVYNVNDENVLGLLTLDTVVTDASGNAAITINNILADSTVTIISAFSNPCCALNIMQEIMLEPQTTDTPLFTQMGPYCSGAVMTPLPLTSINGVTGTWSPVLNNAATTTYTFTPAPAQCATDTSMTIQINPAPSGTDTVTICYGDSYTFNGITYTVSNYSATDTFPATGGCDSIVTLNLTVLDPAEQLVIHLDACDQLTYNNQVYTESTVLYDTFYSARGCDSLYRETHINIHNNAASVVVDTAGCGEVWLNGIRYIASTVVRDTLQNSIGCDSLYRLVNITVHQFNMQHTLNPEDPYEMERFSIKVSDEYDGNFEILSWQPEHLFRIPELKEQYLSLSEAQDISVYGRSREGCMDSVLIPVSLRAYTKEAAIPNAFSPNGDGLNDVFIPKLKLERAYSTFEFRVYNRYGQMVYNTANMNSGWDGTYKGRPQEKGVYFYKIAILFLDGSIKNFDGELTLVR